VSKNIILGIDPGPKEHAFVWWDCEEDRVVGLHTFSSFIHFTAREKENVLCKVRTVACEWIESYGMAVGQEVFRTVAGIGWLAGTIGTEVRLVPRKSVKMHLCNSLRAKDGNIRQALIDRFGPQGTKKAPGPLFGVTSHYLAALAVAVYAAETKAAEGEYWIEDLRKRSIV
jgi:hypothetical protein